MQEISVGQDELEETDGSHSKKLGLIISYLDVISSLQVYVCILGVVVVIIVVFILWVLMLQLIIVPSQLSYITAICAFLGVVLIILCPPM